MNPYKVVERVNNFLYSSFNLVSLLSLKVTKHIDGKNKILKKNETLKTIKNDTCIICGNGPSLREFDFKSVEGIPIFTVNYFFNGSTNLDFTPSYHVVIDDGFKKEIGENEGFNYIKKAYSLNPNTKFIFRYDMLNQLKTIDPSLSHAYFVYYKNIQYSSRFKYDMSGMMSACHNVVLMALQSALFMGYKNIYLIGCENNFFGNYNHFYASENSEYKPSTWDGLIYIDMAFKHYDAIRVHADKNKINIVNITPKSYINSFIQMSLDEFYLKIKGLN